MTKQEKKQYKKDMLVHKIKMQYVTLCLPTGLFPPSEHEKRRTAYGEKLRKRDLEWF